MFKKIILLALILFVSMKVSFAQSPNLINYQGVAHQANGTAISNQNLAVRLSIHHASSNGAIQYSETRNVITDAEGLFNLQIGSAGATSTSGSWSAITWDNGAKYLQVEMDISGGSTFANMGTQQLVTVPYAQYTNKAGSLIPSATINPNQINASGATTNQVLKFDGTTWVPSTIPSSSSFILPYNGTDTNANLFTIVNSNTVNGTAIRGTSAGSANTSAGVSGTASGILGAGVNGSSAGSFGIGVSGTCNSPNGIGVKGSSTDGVGVKGLSTNGTAIIGNSTNGIAINGASVNGTGIFGSTSGNNKDGVYGVTSGNNGSGVEGNASNPTSVGVRAIHSASGTALYASSGYGYALETNGFVKIGGSNMNPSDGAVLTSDASGNATWKNVKVGFQAGQSSPSFSNITAGTIHKLKFHSEMYDASNNFNIESAITDKSTFIAPINGLFHFDARCLLHISSSLDLQFEAYIAFFVNGNQVQYGQFLDPAILVNDNVLNIRLNEDIHLNAGDKLDVRIYQINLSNLSCSYYDAFFSGHLVFAD